MWPFDKNKAAQAQQHVAGQAQSQLPPKPAPPQLTDEERERQLALVDEHHKNIYKFRLKEFGSLPCHMRQEIIDSLRSYDFFDNFFSAPDLVKKPQELLNLEAKRRKYEQWECDRRAAGADDSYHRRYHGGFYDQSKDEQRTYRPRLHDYRFILEGGITIEELEKIHYDSTAQEELLGTDSKD